MCLLACFMCVLLLDYVCRTIVGIQTQLLGFETASVESSSPLASTNTHFWNIQEQDKTNENTYHDTNNFSRIEDIFEFVSNLLAQVNDVDCFPFFAMCPLPADWTIATNVSVMFGSFKSNNIVSLADGFRWSFWAINRTIWKHGYCKKTTSNIPEVHASLYSTYFLVESGSSGLHFPPLVQNDDPCSKPEPVAQKVVAMCSQYFPA